MLGSGQHGAVRSWARGLVAAAATAIELRVLAADLCREAGATIVGRGHPAQLGWVVSPPQPDVEIGSHELRHYAASASISGGVWVKQVQTLLGHSSAVITPPRTCAHIFPGDEDRTRNVLDAALSPLAD